MPNRTGIAHAATSKAVTLISFWARPLLLAGLALNVLSQADAAVINAASVSVIDVTSAIALANDGDTVVLPAGTATWSSTLTITSAITLQGAGIGQTIIKENLSVDTQMLTFNTAAGKSYRVTGIEFQGGTRTTVFGKGMMCWNGESRSVRVDHCRFNGVQNACIRTGESVCGVIDHNTFILPANAAYAIVVYHSTWNGNQWGDGSWALAPDWGGPGALYFEDNEVDNGSTMAQMALCDQVGGARTVFRYNTFNNTYIDSHGSGSTSRYRGWRHFEIYNNTFTDNPPSATFCVDCRGGTGVFFGNKIYGTTKFLTLHTYRFWLDTSSWGGSDGTNGWDINDTTGGPNGNGVYYSGKAGAGSTELTLVVPGAGWATDQWKNYSIKDTTPNATYPNGFFSVCKGNTSDTITVMPGTNAPNLTKPFAPGDHVEIRKVIFSLDQPGAGIADLPADETSATPVPENLHQTIDPIYSWGNSVNDVPGAGDATTAANGSMVQGVHYFNGIARPGYTPYVYPHPLVSGSLGPPANLRVVN
jgi:hypothetical protein